MIVTFSVVVAPHCPAFGVNVYNVEPSTLVLIVAGFHVPVILFNEVVNKVGAGEFRHSAASGAKVGVI